MADLHKSSARICLNKTLKSIDIFGTENLLRLNKEKLFTTQIGGICTIVFLVLICIALVTFGKEIFEKKEPVILSKIDFSEIPEFSWEKDDFIFNFQYSNGTPIFKKEIEKMFSINICYNDNNSTLVDKQEQYKQSCYEPIQCKSENISTEFTNRLAGPINSYFCFPPEIKRLPLKYTHGDGNSKVLQLDVNICDDLKEKNKTCLARSKIYEILGTFEMHVIGTDSYAGNLNYDNPKKDSYFSKFIKSNKDTRTRLIIFYKTINYLTDEGLIMSNWRENNFYSVNNIETYYINEGNTDVFFSHIFSAYSYSIEYRRSYIKIQGILALVGGLITSIKLILQFFIDYANKSYYFKEIINAMKIKLEIPKEFSLNNSTRIFNTNTPKINETNFQFKQIKSIIPRGITRVKPVMPFCKSLFRVCLSKKSAVVDFYKIEERFNKFFSVEYFLKMKHKINILTILTLTHYQKFLLKYIDDESITERRKLNFEEGVKLLLEAGNSMTYADKKLLELLKL
jgi:hypothetical protein